MAQQSQLAPGLGDYLRPIWRFRFAIVLVTVLAAAAAYAYEYHQPKTYEAATTVYVGGTALEQVLSPVATANQTRSTADQAMLVTAPPVASAVRAELHLKQSTQALTRHVSVSANSNADFLTIKVDGSPAKTVADIANGFAQEYLKQRAAETVQTATSELTIAQSKLAGLRHARVNAGLRNGLLRQIATLEQVLISPPSPGSQVSAAEVPTAAHSPSPERDAAFAGAVALVLCLILAYALDVSDHRLRGVRELESELGLPVLTRLPRVRRLGSRNGSARETSLGLAEGVRTLRVNLDLIRAEAVMRKPFTVLVTSALAGEGKSTVVSQLGLAYRDAGKRVAVIEADLRLPVLADRLGIDHGPGLGELLKSDRKSAAQHASAEEAASDAAEGPVNGRIPHMQSIPRESGASSVGDGAVEVLVAGNALDDPTALLTEDGIRSVLVQLAATCDYDIVLIDSPALLGVSDTLPLLSVADAVLIVVREGVTSRSSAAGLRATLDRIGSSQTVNVVGVVANDVDDEFATQYRRQLRRHSRTEARASADNHVRL